MLMNGMKVCVSCHKEISNDSQVCSYCGTPVVNLLPASTTIKVPDEPVRPPLRDQIFQLTELYDDVVAFLIAGQERPLLVKGNQKIVLGRSGFATDAQPTIDFTPYNGVGLGVSRQHATISRPGDNYVIQDLGSTNGTWVNETRLAKDKFHELKNGDVIRLGQLTFYIYFRLPEVSASPVETIHLRDLHSNAAVVRLTPASLAQDVSPFLMALADIQTICNEVLLRPTAEIAIDAVQVDVANDQISIQLRGAKEAISLAKHHLRMMQRKPRLETVRMGDAASPNGGTTEPRQDLDDLQLILDYLQELAPGRGEERLKAYLDRFDMHLDALAASRLQMIANNPPDASST